MRNWISIGEYHPKQGAVVFVLNKIADAMMMEVTDKNRSEDEEPVYKETKPPLYNIVQAEYDEETDAYWDINTGEQVNATAWTHLQLTQDTIKQKGYDLDDEVEIPEWLKTRMLTFNKRDTNEIIKVRKKHLGDRLKITRGDADYPGDL